MYKRMKFRVWDGEEMHEPPHNFWMRGDGRITQEKHGFGIATEDHEKYKVMTRTFQKDHNNQDIYEGDIIETVYDDIVWVDFNIIKSQFDLVGEDKMNWSRLHKCCPEVIGNIYENPDLI